MRPLFLAPLRLEAMAVRRGAPGAQVERLGMGPGAATGALARLGGRVEAGRPVALLGVAGGLVGDLCPGDIVVASRLLGLEGEEPVELGAGAAVARKLEADGLRVRLAPIVSAPKIVRGSAARAEAGASGAVAVDMESLWCAPLSREHPFCVVRVVLDTPSHEITSPAMAGAALRSFRVLAAVARALATWSPNSSVPVSLSEVGDR